MAAAAGPAAAASVDMELKQHFAELQAQMAETKTKMRQMESQMEGLRLACKRAAATKQQLASLAPGVATYDSLGRMFVLKDVSSIQESLDVILD